MEKVFLNIPNLLRKLINSNDTNNNSTTDSQNSILTNNTSINSTKINSSINADIFDSMIGAMQSINNLINISSSSLNYSSPISSNDSIYTTQPDNYSYNNFSDNNNSLISGLNNLTILNNTNNTANESGCQLLGDFGYFVQGILGVMCFSVLVCNYFYYNLLFYR